MNSCIVNTKKQKIKQKIAGVIVVAFMCFMILGTVNVNFTGAYGDNTILEQVVTGGTLSLESPPTVTFNEFVLNASAFNSLANMVQVNMRDPRGTGDGWTVVGSANDMTAANAATIGNEYLRWSPGTIYALDGSSNTGVAAGAAYSGNFGDGTRPLANAGTGYGMGNYVINGTTLNLFIPATTPAGTYQGTLLLTIS